MRIDRIIALAGNAPPSKPSMRITAPGPAMSWSCCCRIDGSSESASICSRVRVVPNDGPFRSAAACCLSCSTVTAVWTRSIVSTATCLFSPFRTRTSVSNRFSNPGNST
ncbi:MAG: hypothetical protein AUI11_02200 [Acidobacteria bacterium 13_2_20CM_2_66_4]|nr:MAG: hypothetical protein AUI11_02200 [Acidobacteria bacterium 13_2_20CM_2_66_4]